MVGAVAEAFQVKWALAKVTVLGGRQSSKNTVGVWGLGCGITGQVSDTRFTLSETKIRHR